MSKAQAYEQGFNLEAEVGRAIATALGPTFRSVHRGQTDEHDCTILAGDIEHGFVEVTRDADPRFEQASMLLADREELVIRDLRPGTGEWVVSVDLSVRVSRLETSELQGVIDGVVALGLTSLYIDFDPEYPNRTTWMTQLGIMSMFTVGSLSDRVHVLFEPTNAGVFIRSDSDLLFDYARDLLGQDRILRKIQLLLDRTPTELKSWLAVVVSSASPSSVYLRMIGVSFDPGLPQANLSLPNGVGGVWIVSPGCDEVVGFRTDAGWTQWSKPDAGPLEYVGTFTES